MGKIPYELITLPKVSDVRGNLTFIESGVHLPFVIKRVYYLYDVPGGEERGGHALKSTQQTLIAVSGSFDVRLDDGRGNRETISLNRSYYGLYVPPMTWRVLDNFSSGEVCLSLVSTSYSANDYYRDYEEFVRNLPDVL